MNEIEAETFGFKTSPCRGCGKPIVWAETSLGKRIPLDPRAPVYHVIPDTQASAGHSAIRDKERMVSHFATCPKANQF